MLKADAMEDPCALFDPDPTAFPDNLSISIDNLFKFLDENPDSSTPPHEAPPSGTLKDFHQGNLAHGQVNFEKAFHPQPGMLGSTPVMEDLTELESSHWDSSNCMQASDCKKEISVELLFGSEGSFNNFSDICHPSAIDNGNPHFSQYADSKTFCSLPANHPDDWLTLSSSEDNTSLMDSVGGSLDDLITNNFDYQQMDINMPKCSTSSAEGSGLLYLPYTDYVNDLYLDSGQEKDFVQMGGETSFQAGVEESISDEKKDSLFMRQNGGIDSSHIMPTEKTGFSGTLHDMNTIAVPVSTVQEGNIHATISMRSSMDPVKTLPDALHAEANTMEGADAICNAGNSFLTLLRDSVIDGETAPNQILPDQRFPIFLSREKEAMIRRKDEGEGQQLQLQNSCVTSEVKFSSQEVSLDMAMPEVSVIDLDAPFSGVLCAEQNHCGDTSFSSESSTDSSSVPFHILNRSIVNNAKQSVPDSKIILPSKKQKSLSKDKREDRVPASCYEEYDTPKSSYDIVHGYTLNSSLSVDEDADICILDNISNPARPSPPPVHMKLHPVSQQSGFSGLYYSGSGGMRLKADDERLTFRIALQKKEACVTGRDGPRLLNQLKADWLKGAGNWFISSFGS